MILSLTSCQLITNNGDIATEWMVGAYSPDISRDSVTSLELNKITRHNLARRYHAGLAVANYTGGGRAQRPKRVHCLLGRVFLEETHDDIEQDDKRHDAAFNIRTNAETHSHSHDEDLQL